MANVLATSSCTGPAVSLLRGHSVSAHNGNKGSSLLQRQIKTNMDPKGQKGDNCTELAMITLSHCSRRIEQHNPNLNAWCLALLFPSEANKKIKVKRPEVSGKCGHANKIFIEPKINLA